MWVASTRKYFLIPPTGTVVWPCGADLDPDVLYALVTGQPIPGFESPARLG
ncbi:MAG TPA: hypothetical protein VMV69_09030 [Pirellulales bacterium]|nr:hypothetical protein [Pirellulales bacterium]